MGSWSFESKNTILERIKEHLAKHYGRIIEEATPEQLYKACATVVRDDIMRRWAKSREHLREHNYKRLYYLSVEFLMGRALRSNIINLLQEPEYFAAFREIGVDFTQIEEEEPDAGLGNGGLGRLAACFLDSLATLALPSMGCGIRYEYGLFKQKIEDGHQLEVPDNWLDEGCIWEVEVPKDTQEIRFGGTLHEEWRDGRLYIRHEGYTVVNAVPFDIPQIGYDSPLPSTLRLWSARSPVRLDMASFSRGEYIKALQEKELAEVISKVLYPEDTHYEGKQLRLKQQYFFASATVQYAIKHFKRKHINLWELPDYVCMQINDTHPAFAIPEMMRILMDEEGMDWESAQDITSRVFSYTNHTILSEALERWPVDMVQSLLPRIAQIIYAINDRYVSKLSEYFPGQWEKINGMAVVASDKMYMANLCVAMTHRVNGVSALHAAILKRTVFRDAYIMAPDKFIGITNGITHRRWLMKANHGLASLINEAIGDKWKSDPNRLDDLVPFADDAAFREKFAAVKLKNKHRLNEYFWRTQDIKLNVDARFDVQAKRLHEYKRQLLNIFHVMDLYNRLKDDPYAEIDPITFVFGAKAAPGYIRAKEIIRLINNVGRKISEDPSCKGRLQVAFLENYNVSPAEVLMPATDVSEQISTAGKEASGTGNMKFMMNGAVTLGTLDGANVEISQYVGHDNIYIFGLSAEQADALAVSGQYRANEVFEHDPRLRRVMEQLIDGTYSFGGTAFNDIYNSLLFNEADRYFVLKDFADYCCAQERIRMDYRDSDAWLKKAIINTAKSGFLSSDNTIRVYNDRVWRLTPYSE